MNARTDSLNRIQLLLTPPLPQNRDDGRKTADRRPPAFPQNSNDGRGSDCGQESAEYNDSAIRTRREALPGEKSRGPPAAHHSDVTHPECRLSHVSGEQKRPQHHGSDVSRENFRRERLDELMM